MRPTLWKNSQICHRRIEIKKICYIYIIQYKKNRVRSSYFLFIAVLVAMGGYSCKERGGKNLDQGEIHYTIEYKGNFGVPKEALPQNLVVAFKEDKILFELIGLGNSGISNLANPEKEIYDTYFSFFVYRYYYAGEPGELYPGFEAMNGLKLKKTSRTTVICGYNCKHAEVTFNSDVSKAYEIWCTDEIDVKNPNDSTPFRDIDGVLMSFFFLIGSSELHFMAENVYEKEIPDEVFDRRDKYIRVSKENIREVMNKLMNY